MTSWVLALGLGMGLATLGLSLWARAPILITWSTPGAAVIASAAAGVSLPEATGATSAAGTPCRVRYESPAPASVKLWRQA